MFQVEPGIKFKFGDEVEVESVKKTAKIKGRIKGTDCYIAIFSSACSEGTVKDMILKFGLPNRHLELQWGSFAGYETEFIIPVYMMNKVIV